MWACTAPQEAPGRVGSGLRLPEAQAQAQARGALQEPGSERGRAPEGSSAEILLTPESFSSLKRVSKGEGLLNA